MYANTTIETVAEKIATDFEDTLATGGEKEVEVFSDAEIEKLVFYIQSEEVT